MNILIALFSNSHLRFIKKTKKKIVPNRSSIRFCNINYLRWHKQLIVITYFSRYVFIEKYFRFDYLTIYGLAAAVTFVLILFSSYFFVF